MVTCRGANHAPLELLGRQVRHFVVGAAQLETKYRLLVFAFQQNGVAQASAQALGDIQVGFFSDVVNLGIQNAGEVVGGAELGRFGGVGHGGRAD